MHVPYLNANCCVRISNLHPTRNCFVFNTVLNSYEKYRRVNKSSIKFNLKLIIDNKAQYLLKLLTLIIIAPVEALMMQTYLNSS